MKRLAFFVPGRPIPKQGTRFSASRQTAYADRRVADWQGTVGIYASQALNEAGLSDFEGDVDNLAKAVLDALKGRIMLDDTHVLALISSRRTGATKRTAGVEIIIHEADTHRLPKRGAGLARSGYEWSVT